jgi:hypothetical protein
MAPSSFSGRRKRKRGRRNWDERGSDAPGACEPTLQARHSQRESAQEPGMRFNLPLI